jgi:uncharacterized protein YdaU (DUF1376 family)
VNYYRRFPGDYQRDTGHLSLTEHGAYTVLLDHYYSLEQPLPASLEGLYRVCRAMTRHEQEAVASVVEQFFPLGPDGRRHNRRCDEEIGQMGARREVASEKGRLGGRPRKESREKAGGKLTLSESESWRKANPFQNGKLEESWNESRGEAGAKAGEKLGESSPDSRLQTPDSRPQRQGLPSSGSEISSSLPACVSHAREAENPQTGEDLWPQAQQAYPKFTGRQDWLTAEHHWQRLIEAGEEPAELLAGVHRYAAYIAAGGVSGPQYVVTPAKFFSAPDRLWQQAWERPPTPSEKREQDALRQLAARRAAIGLAHFREPQVGESSEAYRAAQDAEWQRLKRDPIGTDAARELVERMRLPK